MGALLNTLLNTPEQHTAHPPSKTTAGGKTPKIVRHTGDEGSTHLLVQQRREMAQHRRHIGVLRAVRRLQRGDASQKQRLRLLSIPCLRNKDVGTKYTHPRQQQQRKEGVTGDVLTNTCRDIHPSKSVTVANASAQKSLRRRQARLSLDKQSRISN